MPPKNKARDGRKRGADECVLLTHKEQTILTLFRELSESDRDYLCRVLEALVLTTKSKP
jgi:hypothetical protein